MLCGPHASWYFDPSWAYLLCISPTLARESIAILQNEFVKDTTWPGWLLGSCHRTFRQPRFEQNLNGFRHHASRLIEVSVYEEQLGDIRSSLGRGLTHDLSMGVSLNLCNKIDTWTALLERCHSYPGGTSIRVGFRSTLVSFMLWVLEEGSKQVHGGALNSPYRIFFLEWFGAGPASSIWLLGISSCLERVFFCCLTVTRVGRTVPSG